MNDVTKSIFIKADTVSEELGVSKPTAYKIIQQLNKQLKAEHPNAIVIAGRVNRNWYYDALLQEGIEQSKK